mmetsp:Transcript_96000/g.140254  ORF Transcript_96000/g.140254 Transcript_96000/m.140254 type:complete len:207 (-) Transcript_96000:487-1107(-)
MCVVCVYVPYHKSVLKCVCTREHIQGCLLQHSMWGNKASHREVLQRALQWSHCRRVMIRPRRSRGAWRLRALHPRQRQRINLPQRSFDPSPRGSRYSDTSPSWSTPSRQVSSQWASHHCGRSGHRSRDAPQCCHMSTRSREWYPELAARPRQRTGCRICRFCCFARALHSQVESYPSSSRWACATCLDEALMVIPLRHFREGSLAP